MNTFYIKIHKSYRNVVALCDAEILGKKFEEGIKQLEVRENFYKGGEIKEDEAKKILQDELKDYATFNIVGKKAVALALKIGIVNKGNIGEVGGIPFAIVLL